MTIKSFKCDSCGEEIEYALINGDSLEGGDGLLEDVMLEVRNVDGKPEIKINEDDEWYFEKLNKEYWIKRAKEYAEAKWGPMFECPKCGDSFEFKF